MDTGVDTSDLSIRQVTFRSFYTSKDLLISNLFCTFASITEVIL